MSAVLLFANMVQTYELLVLWWIKNVEQAVV